MRGSKDSLLLTVHGAMEFTWRYAWVGFITFVVVRRSFPLLEALGIFALASVVTLLSRGKGWRILYILVLQAAGLAFAAGVMVHAFYYKAFPFWNQGWISYFFACQRTHIEWFVLLLIFFWILFFWVSGVILGHKPLEYYRVCDRFDLGFSAFIVLYLFEWIALTRGGIPTPDPFAGLLIFPYFLFSIFAIGLARNRDNVQREYLAGYRGIGMISTILAIVVLIAAALCLLMLPALTVVAEAGYAVMKEAAKPLGPVILGVLRFILTGRSFPQEASSGTNDKEAQLSRGAVSENTIWEEIIQWGLTGLCLAVLLALAILGGWLLFQWFLSRTAPAEKSKRHGCLIILWAKRILAFLHYCRSKLIGHGRKCGHATRLYAKLLAWGSRSGLSRLQIETPGEYGNRLCAQFPALAKEILFIIELYHEEVYGERGMTQKQWMSARSVWRHLQSPLNWPSRLRSWFFRPGITAGTDLELFKVRTALDDD